MVHHPDSKKEEPSEQIPVIDQLCNLSRASKVVETSPAGLDPANNERPQPRKLKTYPIFDRDGEVARMISVEKPLISADPEGTSTSIPSNTPGKESPEEKPVSFCGMIGNSKQMRALFDLILLVSSSSTTILIYGESGTGKELVARAIHQCSARKNRKFIPVDCGALPEALLESELFGHVKG